MTQTFARLIPVIALTACSVCAQDVRAFLKEANKSYGEAKDNILKSAEQMPADSYAFRPAPDSKTFGELIEEVTASQFKACSAVRPSGSQPQAPYGQTKAELLEALKGSITACDSAYSSVTALNADKQVQFGTMWPTKLGLLNMNAAHDHQIYGQMMVYLRLKGLIPPSDQDHLVPVD